MSYDLIIHRGNVAIEAPHQSENPLEVVAPDGTVLTVPVNSPKVINTAVDVLHAPISIEVAPLAPNGTVGPTEMQWTSGGGGWVDPNVPPPGGGGDEPPIIE